MDADQIAGSTLMLIQLNLEYKFTPQKMVAASFMSGEDSRVLSTLVKEE
jgi:hypothetical protein